MLQLILILINYCKSKCRGFLSLWKMLEKDKSLTSNRLLWLTPDFSMRSSPEVFSTEGYFHKTAGHEIRVFPLLGEMPMATEPHLPVCQLYRWQLGPSKWSSPTANSLDIIVVNAIKVGIPWESLIIIKQHNS